ncbi:MAG: nuclear transport factor 2 family protein [Alphaproteobacteria bacterium]
MSADLEKRIQRLEDIEEIKKMIARYAQAGDDKNNPDIFGPMITEDAIWEAEGFGQHKGRDVITKVLSEVAQEKILWALHFMTSPLIDIAEDGKTATAMWYLWETAIARDDREAEGKSTWIGGWYETDLRREADGKWRWNHIRLMLKLFSPNEKPEWDIL